LKKELEQLSIKKEVTMSAAQANLRALVFLVPLILVLGIPYYYVWPDQFTKAQITRYVQIKEAWSLLDWALILIVIFIGIITHELLHGLGWSLFAKKGWKSIRFGIMWSFLTPYCHCSEPLMMKPYRIGSILPALVLGIIPSLIAMLTGNLILMTFGFFFTFAAGGDFLILWMVRKEPGTTIIQDHPDKIGCVIYHQKSTS
jgi:hypothetical protein